MSTISLIGSTAVLHQVCKPVTLLVSRAQGGMAGSGSSESELEANAAALGEVDAEMDANALELQGDAEGWSLHVCICLSCQCPASICDQVFDTKVLRDVP